MLVHGLLAYEGGGGATRQVIVDQAALQHALSTLVMRRAPVVGPFIPVPANDGFTYRVRLLPKRPCASPDRCPEAVVLQVLP